MTNRDNGADPLSAVLETIRLHGAVFFQWQPGWPYSTGVCDGTLFRHLIAPAADTVVSYHIVSEGPCWACVDSCVLTISRYSTVRSCPGIC